MTLVQPREEDAPDAELPGMIGRDAAMRRVFRLVRRLAPSDLPTLVTGETGTGKELVARALHQLSRRAHGPFVDLNCAALPEALAEGELFGWERGAFTGAHQAKAGLLEIADGGTAFLDEVSSLPTVVQGKLLRAVERHEFRRVGGRQLIHSDFRLVTATSEQLGALRASRAFRDDFLFRVAGAVITLPPLRERGDDIRLLAEHFLRAASHAMGRPLRWHEGALAMCASHAWPGNVRELLMLVQRVAVLAEHDVVGVEDLVAGGFVREGGPADPQAIARVIEACGGNISHAARALGIPRSTLRLRLTRVAEPR
jgi:DNA-binding NtrC family response regulator